jgi:hypothetical protein
MIASPGSPTASLIRVQCIKSEGLLSGPLAVSMGVPQGSILRLTLFSVYNNDVALAAGDSLIHVYADTILYTSGPSCNSITLHPSPRPDLGEGTDINSHPRSIVTHRSTKAAALAEQGLRASDVTD